MGSQLVKDERIKITLAKAKEVCRLVDNMVPLGFTRSTKGSSFLWSKDKIAMFYLGQESRTPMSLENLFEVAADDLQQPNDTRLLFAENPILISAVEQIFGVDGKRMRPGLVFLVSRDSAESAGLN